MKKVLLAMLGVLTALPALAHDFSFSYKGQTLTYSVVDAEAKTCRVAQNAVTGAVEVPAQAIDGDVAYTVTAVANDAFFGCNTITSIALPAGMRSIGRNAFSRCTMLESVTLPDSLSRIEPRTFEQCTSLSAIVIPGKVSSIGDHAFDGCSALTEVNLPSGISTIEESTFEGCYNLADIMLPGSLRTIGKAAFRQCRKLNVLSIVNSVNSIGESAFENCTGITTLVLGNGLGSIGNRAFADCSSLNRIYCGEGLTTPPRCGTDAFAGVSVVDCQLLVPASAKDVYIGANGWNYFANYLPNAGRMFVFVHEGQTLTYCVIDEYLKTCKVAQQGTSISGSVIIPSSVNDGTSDYAVVGIDNNAFQGHGLMSAVQIPESVTWVGNSAFADCNGLQSITLPNSVTYLGEGAFKDCRNLSAVILSNSINDILQYTFYSCHKLNNITIPNSVQYIGYAAFRYSGLTSITLSNSIKQLASEALSDTRLSSIKLPESLEIIEGLAFNNTPIASIFIPKNVNRIDGWNWAYAGVDVRGPLLTGSMQRIDVAEDNAIFCSVDGVLFNKSKSKLIRFPEAKADSYVIPDGTEIIGGKAFANNNVLTSVTIPNSVVSIEENAFRNSTGITSVVVPVSVKVLEHQVFCGCSNLVSLTLPSTMTHINGIAISGTKLSSLTLPQSLVYIGRNAFENCKYLTEISLPDNVTTIDDEAFVKCSSLAKITIPKSVTKVGANVFNECSSLARIDVAPENTAYCSIDGALYDFNKETLICLPGAFSGEYLVPKTLNINNCSMFDGFANITSFKVEQGHPTASAADGVLFNVDKTILMRYPRGKVGSDYTMPNSVETIADHAFKDCGRLTSLNIPNSVKSIGESAFRGCGGLDSLNIPNSVTTVKADAFTDCRNLKKVDLPNSITSLGENTFFGCGQLPTVNIPNTLTRLPGYMFFYGGSLRSLTIPKSIKVIGRLALPAGLRKIQLLCEEPPTSEGDMLYYWDKAATDECLIIVPDGSAETYRQVYPWSRFKNIKEESEFITWSVEDINERVGKPIALSVAMSNPTPVSSFQCDIHLPEGVRPVIDEDGCFDITLSADRKATAHVIDGAVQRSGAVRVIAYSSDNSLFKLNEGELFSMALESTAAQPGVYEVTIDSIVGVNQYKKPFYLAPATGRIELRPRMILGDVNDDEVLNMTDVTCTVSHILGSTPEGFVFEAADINLDKVINVADVNEVVDKVLAAAATSAAAPQRAAAMAVAPATADNGYLYIKTFFLQPGEETQMPVRLKAPRRYCAFQTDMYLPEGVEVVTVDKDGKQTADVWLNAKSATTSHTIVTRAQADGALRVAAYSGSNASFKGTSDEILFYVRVRANESFRAVPQPVWFRNTLFNTYVDNTPAEYYFLDNNPHMNVDGVLGSADVEVAAEAIYYNLQGLRVAEPQRGKIYIRLSGGKAEKVVY